MIKQLSLPLNSKQKSMYIIPLQPLRLQKTQGQCRDCDLLTYFITVMAKGWSAVCSWRITYIMFIFVCVRNATCIDSPLVVFLLQNHVSTWKAESLHSEPFFKNEKLLYGNVIYFH